MGKGPEAGRQNPKQAGVIGGNEQGEWHERKMCDPDTRFMGLWEEFDGYGLDTTLAPFLLSLEAEHQFKKPDCNLEGLSLRNSEFVCVCGLDSCGVQWPQCLESPVSGSGCPALVCSGGGASLSSSHSTPSPQRITWPEFGESCDQGT